MAMRWLYAAARASMPSTPLPPAEARRAVVALRVLRVCCALTPLLAEYGAKAPAAIFIALRRAWQRQFTPRHARRHTLVRLLRPRYLPRRFAASFR